MEIKAILEKHIQHAEKVGDQAGGSGHLANVSCELDRIIEQKPVANGTQITFTYHKWIVTEFTIEPDNPPEHYVYQQSVVLDQEGAVLTTEPKVVLLAAGGRINDIGGLGMDL